MKISASPRERRARGDLLSDELTRASSSSTFTGCPRSPTPRLSTPAPGPTTRGRSATPSSSAASGRGGPYLRYLQREDWREDLVFDGLESRWPCVRQGPGRLPRSAGHRRRATCAVSADRVSPPRPTAAPGADAALAEGARPAVRLRPRRRPLSDGLHRHERRLPRRSASARDFFTDFRYTERAEAEVGEGWERPPAERELRCHRIAARHEGPGRLRGGEPSVRQRARSSARPWARASSWSPPGDLVEELRAVKDAARSSASPPRRSSPTTSRWAIEQWPRRPHRAGRRAGDPRRDMRELGAEPSFPPIIAAGPNGALPHAEPGEREIGKGELVVFDMGAELDGYCSDCTRTFATGEIDGEAREVYELVLSAQETALGRRASRRFQGVDADAASQDRSPPAGHGEHYGHGLGHGVGIEVHEAPRLSPQLRRRPEGGRRRHGRARGLSGRPLRGPDRGPGGGGGRGRAQSQWPAKGAHARPLK